MSIPSGTSGYEGVPTGISMSNILHSEVVPSLPVISGALDGGGGGSVCDSNRADVSPNTAHRLHNDDSSYLNLKNEEKEKILMLVLPLLEGEDLATCMLVCKQWGKIAQNDYFWKCLCAKKWPSLCNQSTPPAISSYHELFKSFYDPDQGQVLLPPRLSFNDLDFYIDIWAGENLVFSEMVPGPLFQKERWTPPQIGNSRSFFYSPVYKMTPPVQPRFVYPEDQTVRASVFVVRKDSIKIACLLNSPVCHASKKGWVEIYDYPQISPAHPFVLSTAVYMILFFLDYLNEEYEGPTEVCGMELDFGGYEHSEDEVLWLLDILDWK